MGLERSELRKFYSVPWIREAIFRQCADRYVCMRFWNGLQRHYGPEERQYNPRLRGSAYISFDSLDAVGPHGLQYWINKGVQEFIPEVSTRNDLDRSEYFVIDLDPKGEKLGIPEVRVATVQVLCSMLRSSFAQQNFRNHYWVRYSGNRSFHLYFWLKRRQDMVKIREAVKVVVGAMNNPGLSYQNLRGKTDYILVDIGAIARHRCVRSLWSVHHKTGRVCVPLLYKDIPRFDPNSATVDNVLAGKFGQTDIESRWG